MQEACRKNAAAVERAPDGAHGRIKMIGYYDSQQGKICPDCELQGVRSQEQDAHSIFATYSCPNGHEFEIDRVLEFDMGAFSEALRKDGPLSPATLALLWKSCRSGRDLRL